MINLIPQSAKKQIVIEYWLRVVTVWLLLFSITATIGTALMFPVYILVKTQTDVYRESANAAVQKIAVYENVSEDLVRSSQQAKMVLDNKNQPYLSQYIKLFSTLETSSLELSGISITRGVTGVDSIQVAGTAIDRKALADFRDRLLALEQVEKVDFPISNLAKDKDISFNMVVTLKKQVQS